MKAFLVWVGASALVALVALSLNRLQWHRNNQATATFGQMMSVSFTSNINTRVSDPVRPTQGTVRLSGGQATGSANTRYNISVAQNNGAFNNVATWTSPRAGQAGMGFDRAVGSQNASLSMNFRARIARETNQSTTSTFELSFFR